MKDIYGYDFKLTEERKQILYDLLRQKEQSEQFREI